MPILNPPKIDYPFAPSAQDWLYDNDFSHGAFRLLSHIALKGLHAKNIAYKFKREYDENGVLVNHEELAKRFGVTVKTIQNWINECVEKHYLVIVKAEKNQYATVKSFAKSNGEEIIFLNLENNFQEMVGANRAPYKEGEIVENTPIDIIDNSIPSVYECDSDESALSEEFNASNESAKALDKTAGLTIVKLNAPPITGKITEEEWQRLTAGAVDEEELNFQNIDEDGNEIRGKSSFRRKSEIETLIIGWGRSHGLPNLKQLKSQSLAKLSAPVLRGADRTLIQCGKELFFSPLAQSLLETLAQRERSRNSGRAPFSQDDIINALIASYGAWRSSEGFNDNPELVALEQAVLLAFGQTYQTVTESDLKRLRTNTLAPLHTAGCRAEHIPALVATMSDKKTAFLARAWTDYGGKLKTAEQKVKWIPAPAIDPYAVGD